MIIDDEDIVQKMLRNGGTGIASKKINTFSGEVTVGDSGRDGGEGEIYGNAFFVVFVFSESLNDFEIKGTITGVVRCRRSPPPIVARAAYARAQRCFTTTVSLHHRVRFAMASAPACVRASIAPFVSAAIAIWATTDRVFTRARRVCRASGAVMPRLPRATRRAIALNWVRIQRVATC